MYWRNELLLSAFTLLTVAVNYRYKFGDFSLGAGYAPARISKISKNGGILGSAKDDVEIRAMAIAVPLHPAKGKPFAEYCLGAWGRPQISKIYM
jgi:hypothetical protein